MKTIGWLLQKVGNKIDQLDTEILLAHVLKRSREYLVSYPEEGVRRLQATRFRRLVAERGEGAPLAYLTGRKEFFGLDFIVNTHVLIPRPETETLVGAALEEIKSQLSIVNCQLLIIDVGAGSGCIPISIIKTLKHKNIKTFATEISRRALRVAKKNAARHGVNINFLHGNLLEPIVKNLKSEICNLKLIITANLPYLTGAQYNAEPSIRREPKLALVANDNGLALYAELLGQIKQLVSCYLCHVSCFMEIDPSQSRRIVALIHNCLPRAKIEIKPDLTGRERVVVIDTTPDF